MNTNQALEDHSIRHARILEALETEKQKIAKEVQILQQNQSNRDKTLSEYMMILAGIFKFFMLFHIITKKLLAFVYYKWFILDVADLLDLNK